MRESLRRKGLQGQGFKAWSMSKKSWSLILPFAKNLGGAFEHNFALEQSNHTY